MKPYVHQVHYYETDKMGITHHSNYVRFMEEARVDYLNQLGTAFDKIEADGISSPVITLECSYKKTTTFPDEIFIYVKPKIRLFLKKTIQTSAPHCTGKWKVPKANVAPFILSMLIC